MRFDKPAVMDIPRVGEIMEQWTKKEEVDKYSERIRREILGENKYNMQFFVVKDSGKIIGVGGISDIHPKVKKFSKKKNPGAIKIIYLDDAARGKGYGRFLLENLESVANENNYDELLIRSAERYRDTAYGFYEKMGYEQVGEVQGGKPDKVMAVFRKDSLQQ
jgi:GNAT superfamily N-acetyltransferase